MRARTGRSSCIAYLFVIFDLRLTRLGHAMLNIVVEGMDESSKSYLVSLLSKHLVRMGFHVTVMDTIASDAHLPPRAKEVLLARLLQEELVISIPEKG